MSALSAFFDSLLTKLKSPEFLESAPKNCLKFLKNWENNLLHIRPLLSDAEEKQLKDMVLKEWLVEVQDLAHNMDDILDVFATESLESKLMPKRHKVKIAASRFVTNNMMISEVKAVSDRLANLKAPANIVASKRRVIRPLSTVIRPLSTLLGDLDTLYKKLPLNDAIVESLLKNPHDGVAVISIFGMGGVGKTFAARVAFNDVHINNCFELKFWICVSDFFDVTRITKCILEQIDGETYDATDLRMLQMKLKEKLNNKKFLAVLDDVWNERYAEWEILRLPLEIGAPGSKILVTTRNKQVSQMMKAVEVHIVKPLPEEACLSVVTMVASGERYLQDQRDHLKTLSKEIYQKCHGLPLAARAIGFLLRYRGMEEWKHILERDELDLSDTLKLSYDHLPPLLKSCFAYCSIFPKGYEFREEEIVLLWMAQGFLSETTNKTEMETLGREFFQQLVASSIFSRSSMDESQFQMHDLFHDLAQLIAKPICFRMEHPGQMQISEHVRHLSYDCSMSDGFRNFKPPANLRTFIFLSPRHTHHSMPNDILLDLLPRLKFLRVLSLRGFSESKLPDFIEKLRHLRYLDLSHAAIKSLPDSMGALHNLQTLLLIHCLKLEKLPSKIGNLVNLRHLYLTGTFYSGMPEQIRQLTNLQTLWTPDGRCIRGREDISEDGLEASAGLSELRVLNSKWSENTDGRRLVELVIEGYDDTISPNWLSGSLFSSLQSLELSNCKNWRSMPSIGNLRVLKNLCVKRMSSLSSIGVDCFTGNSSLETLLFEDMPEWKDWNLDKQAENFRHLRELSVIRCPKLSRVLSSQLPSLKKLTIHRCDQLVVSIPSLPVLHQLEIDGCKKLDVPERLVELSSLEKVSLSSISKLTRLPRLMFGFTKVKYLEIDGCQGLTSLWENQWEALVRMKSLKVLTISNCQQLVPFGAGVDEGDRQQLVMPCSIDYLNLSSKSSKLTKVSGIFSLLSDIRIENCPMLVSFSEESFPVTLKSLVIRCCENLMYFMGKEKNMNFRNISFLEDLNIEKCPSLIALCSTSCDLPINIQKLHINHCPKLASLSPRRKLPKGLTQLHIGDCQKLESIGDELPVGLQRLKIWNCESLTALSGCGRLPEKLKYLQISHCLSLDSIAGEIYEDSSLEELGVIGCGKIRSLPKGMHKLSFLKKIVYVYCPSLSFEESWLPPPTNLRTLHIDNCENLAAFPIKFNDFSTLQELELFHCPFPELLYCPLPNKAFPANFFPANLKLLSISQPKPSKPLEEWGLDIMTCLEVLRIEGGYPNLVSFPPKESSMILPSSLVDLTIKEFPSLKSLSSNVFEKLKKLKYLSIMDCPKLRSLPTKDALRSLHRLHIDDCPLLRPKCKRTGKEWSKIAHVDYVRIDDELIQAPKT